MNLKKEKVHGYWLQYPEELQEGMKYLRDDLQQGEAKTFFDASRVNGIAEFEDDYDHDWTLIYNRGDNTYTLTPRQRE